VSQSIEICVPDIGDFDEVEVVEILIAKGDVVEVDDPLVSIESDKATMEIPSTHAGMVSELRVVEGDRVSEGSVLVLLDVEDVVASEPSKSSTSTTTPKPQIRAPESTAADSSVESEAVGAPDASVSGGSTNEEVRSAGLPQQTRTFGRQMSPAAANPVPDRPGSVHASPLVRRYARELGVPLEEAQGSGPHQRVLVDDLKRRVRQQFSERHVGKPGPAAGVPPSPAVDFAAFGPIREEPLTRIQKVSGPSLHRSWLNVPHVTQHDEADVTELERFRKDRRDAASESGVKLSPLLFVMKAVVGALREFPILRSSLAPEGDRLIVKEYFHLGIAVDTDQGLVVPVIRDVDQKGILELASEIASTAERARNRRLGPDDLRGAVFTISSLGGIGGIAFSPIVNAPEVAILGLSQTRVQPVWAGPSPIEAVETSDSAGHFEPRLVLPLSLSYDHRVIDGAEAVRFTTRLARFLSDPSMLLL
jgi:pyruvate dehydrogenase E2 component (dihydrolipoamide acetyltransferase)